MNATRKEILDDIFLSEDKTIPKENYYRVPSICYKCQGRIIEHEYSEGYVYASYYTCDTREDLCERDNWPDNITRCKDFRPFVKEGVWIE